MTKQRFLPSDRINPRQIYLRSKKPVVKGKKCKKWYRNATIFRCPVPGTGRMAGRRNVCAENEQEKETGIGLFSQWKRAHRPQWHLQEMCRGLQAEFPDCDCLLPLLWIQAKPPAEDQTETKGWMWRIETRWNIWQSGPWSEISSLTQGFCWIWNWLRQPGFCMPCCWIGLRFQGITDGRMKKGIFTWFTQSWIWRKCWKRVIWPLRKL